MGSDYSFYMKTIETHPRAFFIGSVSRINHIFLFFQMEENKGDVMTFLVISAAIEWLESHHLLMKAMADAKLRAKKDAEEAILTVSFQ